VLASARARTGIVVFLLGLVAAGFLVQTVRRMQLEPIDAIVVSADGITARLRLTVNEQQLQTSLHGADAADLSVGQTVPMRCDLASAGAECFAGTLWGEATAFGVLALLLLGGGIALVAPALRSRGSGAVGGPRPGDGQEHDHG
jgi:hypothetical protein